MFARLVDQTSPVQERTYLDCSDTAAIDFAVLGTSSYQKHSNPVNTHHHAPGDSVHKQACLRKEPETTPQGPRSPLSPQSPGFAEVFADEADVDGWRLAFAAKQRLSVKRDEDVDKEPTYALSCRCGTFKWTIPKLPFARFEALDGAIKQPPLRPSLAFPRRTRFLRAPPAETALDAWCDILSQNVRAAAALEPPTTDLADALDALGEILRLDEAKPNIDAAGAVLEKPQLQTKTPRRPATNGALAARDASVDRRLDSVAAKLRALRKGRTGRKPGKRPSRRALAALRVDAPEVTDGSPPPPPPRPSSNALSPNNFSERGRAPVLAASATATLLHIPPRRRPSATCRRRSTRRRRGRRGRR